MNSFLEGSWEAAALDALWGMWPTTANLTNPIALWDATDAFTDGAAIKKLGVWAWNHTPLGTGMEGFVMFLAAKHHDYGPTNILRFGQNGLAVRSWDKVARILNLEARADEGTVEPLSDAYKDIVGYCVISAMLANGTFERPLEADMYEDLTSDSVVRYGDIVWLAFPLPSDDHQAGFSDTVGAHYRIELPRQ